MFLHSETPENSGQVGDNIAKYNKVLADCNNSIWQYSGVRGVGRWNHRCRRHFLLGGGVTCHDSHSTQKK